MPLEKQGVKTFFVETKRIKKNTHLDIGDVVGSDFDVHDAAGLLAHDCAAVLQADDRAVVADEAFDLPGESRAGGRDEGGTVAHQTAPRRDGGVVVFLRERGVEQRADGGVVRGGGRHGRRHADELVGTDEEGRRVVLGDDELHVGRGRDERGGQGHEGRGENEEGELDGKRGERGIISMSAGGERGETTAVSVFGPQCFRSNAKVCFRKRSILAALHSAVSFASVVRQVM